MDTPVKIKALLQQIVGANSNLPITGKVISIEGESCTVQLISGLKVSDVKLKATINEQDNFILVTPKEGSSVIMLSSTGDLENLTVIKADQFEKMEINQGGLNILIDSNDGKVSIKNDSVSLKEILSDLSELLKNIKVFTPMGPSGNPLPDSIQAIVNFETKVNQLLK
ncbi:hypothetical protein GON26_01335 [Flavobacterium sp. GA093]|uniref:Uncharacterized protein n=1 Tax=Flavobacterium hydrocarbonoxydans TaxID=2683249 RepID=A0A6I4NJM1_9FLAO|nr:hypothetical protein [Flavobacterium hydrocarbonoxydans]MWB92992.1 hypothetical protein [Flavobacterium hydrocarbonoxydans]